MLLRCLIFLLLLTPRIRGEETPIASLTEFPATGSAIYMAGELTYVDHINRVALLRPDRTDLQPKAFQDLPLYLTMLPYGSITYHGAPATLRDVPIGTHLHGLFYLGPKGRYLMKAPGYPDKPNRAFDSQYSQCLRLEDDFSYYRKQSQSWKIESIDTEKQKISAKLSGTEKSLIFDYNEATQVWHGKSIGGWEKVNVGQQVLFNLTWATLFGPGRITDIWLDEESMDLASRLQRGVNEDFIKLRGIPARIDEVIHQEKGRGLVTATVYAGINPELIADLKVKSGVVTAPAEPNLREYGINGASGSIQEVIQTKNPPPGHSGISIRYQVNELLEGIRPGRTVKLYPSGYPRITKPVEELLHPFDIWPVSVKP